MEWMVSFGFLTAQLCGLETHLGGKNHILLSLVDIKDQEALPLKRGYYL